MRKRFYSLFAALIAVLSAAAQVTTSGLGGQITAGGEAAAGAVVEAVHTPSGTKYTAVANEKGRYSIQGMRVGGPYTVKVTYTGYKAETFGGLHLALGEPSAVDADMEEDVTLLGEVVVKGGRSGGSMGAASRFGQGQIANAPTVDRNIYDVAKLSPLVNTNKFGGITIAGANNRYNSFQIDGVVSNDVFGLASSGTNGGQSGANPISLDAIEQIQVAVSPFDIRQSGFTGGAINAITKQGTNTLKGSAYAYHTDENFYGRWSQQAGKSQKLTDETTNTYGFSVGGPILKDKLFFFASLEYKKNSYPASYYPGYDGYFLSAPAAQAILDRYSQVTGLKDEFSRRNINTKGLSLLGRVDWNIDNANKFSLRYQLNDSYKDVYGTGAKSYYFNNSAYRMDNSTNSFVAELNSSIGKSLYNELRAGLTMVRDHREVPYQGPTIYIQNAGAYDPSTGEEASGSNTINLGSEYSSGVNFLDQDIWTIEDNLSWYVGDHTLTFGTHNEFYNMANAFIQAAFGEYVYSGVKNFMADKPSSFIWKYSDETITGTSQWATPFKAGQLGFYAQDKWNATNLLQLTYGLRVDLPVYFNGPTANEEFNSTDFSKKYDAVVGRKPSVSPMFSPRVGFQWYTSDTRATKLRGGLGVFNGRAPFVWIENAWANTGVELKGTTIYSPDAPQFTKYGADIKAAVASAAGKADKPVVNTIDRNFKFPQVFRANLALEQKLPGDVNLTLEGLYSRNINNVWFQNLALIDNGQKVYAVNSKYENSATTYYASKPGSYNAIINTSNTNKGYSYSLSAKLEKSFNFGLDLMASYTFGHSYSVNDGTSSVAASNWGYYYCVDPNSADQSYSLYDIPHRLIAVAAYNSPKYGNGRWQTHVSLTYNGYSGQRYSFIMSDSNPSFNGDYRTGNTLLYIPTEGELAEMEFVGNKNMSADQAREAFGNWIENNSYAKNHRGRYADRNAGSAPWENHFDLHISQDFYYLKERGSKVELTLDIVNLANMLNHDWGTYYSSAYSENILKVKGTKADAAGNMVASYEFQGYRPTISDYNSRWHAQVGLRVTF